MVFPVEVVALEVKGLAFRGVEAGAAVAMARAVAEKVEETEGAAAEKAVALMRSSQH